MTPYRPWDNAHRLLIVAVVILLTGTVSGQGQFGRFHLTGIVTDAVGEPLAGAEIAVEGRSGATVMTDARGAFEIPNLAAGAYAVRAGLPGFRTQTLRVVLPQGPMTPLKFVLRVGLLAYPHYVLSEPEVAIRRATAIARVRLDELAPLMNCAELDVISALHNATVIEVWKGELPEKIQIQETEAGSCTEEDGSMGAYGRRNSSYEIGAEYVVLLTGQRPRFGGLGAGDYVFPVRGETVSTNGFMGLPQTITLREFQLKLRHVLE